MSAVRPPAAARLWLLLLVWLAAAAAQPRLSLLQLLQQRSRPPMDDGERVAGRAELRPPAEKRDWKQPVPAATDRLGDYPRRPGAPLYDVPLIVCPPNNEKMERFACPTPNEYGRYPCIDGHRLCNGFNDCPAGEDEDRSNCMFYKTTLTHLDVLAETLLRWYRGR